MVAFDAMRTGAKASTIRFGDFQLDAARAELRKNDCRVAVQPKVLQLLLFLVKHRARVVSHDEILNALWPDEDVGDASVKRAVRGVRQALGDTAESQAVIRTVVGGGYQFVLPIRVDRQKRREDQGRGARDPCVGRGAVLETLAQIVDEFPSRRGRVVVLYGATGVGKTRTAHEFAELARRRKAAVLSAQGQEYAFAPSFDPVRQLIRASVALRGQERVVELMGDAAAEVVEAIPELTSLFGKVGPPPSIDPAYARQRVFEGLTRFFRRLSEDGAIVLVVDDAHEADAITLQFFAHLAAQVGDAAIALVLSATPERPGEEPLLPPALSRAAAATQVHLAPLDRDAVAALFHHAFQRSIPPGVVDRLNQLTRGNALFCRILVLAHQRAGEPKDFAWLNDVAKARRLEGAIAQRVERLSGSCRSLLSFASAIGSSFSVALLVRVANLRWGSVIECLAEGVAEGLVVAEGTALSARYRFSHGLVKEVVYAGLSSAARVDAHARVAMGAGALSEDPEAVAAQVAHHSAEASPFLGSERAAAQLLSAARIESRRMAYERAVELIDRALSLRILGQVTSQWKLERHVDRAEMLSLAGDAERASAAVASAAELARSLADHDTLYRVSLAACRLPDEGAAGELRAALLEELCRVLPEGDPRLPLVLARLASASGFGGGSEAREGLVRRAIAAGEGGDLRNFGEILRAAHAATPVEQREERRELSERLLRVARRLESPELLLHAYRGRLEDARESGDLPAVERDAAIIEVLSAQTRHPFFLEWHAAFRSSAAAFVDRSG